MTETLNGMEQAVQVYQKRIELVEEFGSLTKITDKDYIKFYNRLLSFEFELFHTASLIPISHSILLVYSMLLISFLFHVLK